MRLYVDDKRPCPEGWLLARTATEAIGLLNPTFGGLAIKVMSLDYDLGDTEHQPEWTGYTVLAWIEERTAMDPNYFPPEIRIHTANPAGRKRLELVKGSIERLVTQKQNPTLI